MTHVVIMRGVSGSGKSTLVEKLSKSRNYKSVFVCSSDHYFIKDGEYNYNSDEIVEAHNYCMKRFLSELPKGHDAVFVDNTNMQRWEFTGYIQVAQALDFTVEIVEVKRDLRECAKENAHGVPSVAINMMNSLWEEAPSWVTVNRFWTIQKSSFSVDK